MRSFSEFLLTETKFLNGLASKCEHCRSNLLPMEITVNSKHVYHIGQRYKCECAKSSIWTNSIRNISRLNDFFQGKEPIYYNGFCNDLFCGFCFDSVYPMKNGVNADWWTPGQRLDRFGCSHCKQNQNILVHGQYKTKESDSDKVLQYYKRHQNEVEKFAKEGF